MRKPVLAGLVAGLLLAGVGFAYAGMWSGLPAATSSPTTGNAVTLPLTGNEVGAFDTGLSGGRNPQTETISVDQIKEYVYGNGGAAGASPNVAGTDSGGASTCNASRCLITTAALTTVANNLYTLNVSNTYINTSSIVLLTLSNGTNTSSSVFLANSTVYAGAVRVRIGNGAGISGAATLNGTVKVGVVVIN